MLRVVTYNVHGLRDDRSALVDVVQDLAPDVLIVQEAPRRLRWRTRNAHLAHDLGLVYLAGGAPSLGNVILTSLRVRALETWELRYPLTPGRHMRGAVFARCAVGGAPFVVVGSHLSLDAVERAAQARLLAKALADVDAPVVLGADLNEPPGGTAWQVLGAALVDGADGVRPAGPWATFPAAAPRQRIDAILVDPRIRVTGYRVAADLPAVRRASDHLPVVAELDLPAPS
jgi:endonuclease/exonuclease/phosphatase family metal-dependent hydrolase